jgi:hypothetical protein
MFTMNTVVMQSQNDAQLICGNYASVVTVTYTAQHLVFKGQF